MKNMISWPYDISGQKCLPAPSKEKKRKRHSALLAASMARSAVRQVKPNSYMDTDYKHTGTNLTYQDDSTSL
jgi:hypothetical protein